MNSIRYFGLTDFEEIDRQTFRDIRLRYKAYALKNLDAERRMHWQAWLNQAVKATKGKKGQPKWKNFKQFFDFEKNEDEILQKKYKPSHLASRMMAWEKQHE